MATLGELLFYIATQQQDSGAGSVSDVSSAWGITSATTAGVVRLLKVGEDEISQHYAVKTIENICSQGGEWAATFSTQVGWVLFLFSVVGFAGKGGCCASVLLFIRLLTEPISPPSSSTTTPPPPPPGGGLQPRRHSRLLSGRQPQGHHRLHARALAARQPRADGWAGGQVRRWGDPHWWVLLLDVGCWVGVRVGWVNNAGFGS